MTTKELRTIETPVLIAWGRRIVKMAKETPGAYACEIETAEKHLRALEVHSGPPVTLADPEGGIVTFSRESKAFGVCNFVARAIVPYHHHYDGGLEAKKAELLGDLTRNIVAFEESR